MEASLQRAEASPSLGRYYWEATRVPMLAGMSLLQFFICQSILLHDFPTTALRNTCSLSFSILSMVTPFRMVHFSRVRSSRCETTLPIIGGFIHVSHPGMPSADCIRRWGSYVPSVDDIHESSQVRKNMDIIGIYAWMTSADDILDNL